MISNTSDQEEAEGRKGRGVWKGKKMKITKIKLKLRQVIFFYHSVAKYSLLVVLTL